MANYSEIRMKKGRDWQLRRGHPWLFSGAIEKIPKAVEPGGLVDLLDSEGQFVARGYYNPKTDIAVRVLTRDPAEEIDQAFFEGRIRLALALRQQGLEPGQTDVFRLINAEGDFLPGVIVDSYAGRLVLQSHTAGIDRLLDPLVAALAEVVQPQAILLRNDVAVRAREGLAKEEPRLLLGSIAPGLVVQENGFRFGVDPWKGQKTGFFTDQRDKRRALQKYASKLPAGATMLNCFSYTAGFSVYAATANPGLRTINVDQSAVALEMARRNFELNKLDPAAHIFEATDAFKWLAAEAERGIKHDIVILDPPAFAKSNREKEKALQGYTRLNRLGLPLVKPGGYLLTCSCTGVVGLEEFENCLREASAQVGCSLQTLEVFENGLDHPVNLAAPEGRYLKVLFCRVLYSAGVNNDGR
jgi:23S rRNA (cytosine1962-C5)-methyltransferase